MPALDAIRVSAFRVPLDNDESDGTLTWSNTEVLVVEPTAGGVEGLGYSYGGPAAATFVHDVLLDVIAGRDALDVTGLWRSMVNAIRNHGRPGIVSTAIAAVDLALWDLKARLLELPLCQLLGMTRDRVPVYGSGGFTSMTDDALASQLTGWVHNQEIPRVKMKVAESWGSNETRDLDRVGWARKVIGEDAELFVDANGGYSRGQAIRMEQRFREFGVSWFEEPVSSDNLDGLKEVREHAWADVAAGEYGYDLASFARMTDAHAVDCLQADITRCAGITEWLRVAALAAARGLDLSGHCAPSQHAHPACAIPNLRHVEYFADHVRADHLLFDGVLEPQPGGFLQPDLDRPGTGLQLKRLDAERFRCGI